MNHKFSLWANERTVVYSVRECRNELPVWWSTRSGNGIFLTSLALPMCVSGSLCFDVRWLNTLQNAFFKFVRWNVKIIIDYIHALNL